jgi:fermentation-respiration switch protein FrsA (DUF1100 family)
MPIIKIIITITVMIFFFSFLIFLLYIKPTKFHTNVTPDTFNLEYENISFKTKDGLTLRGWFIPANSSNYSNAAIIIGHGFPFDKNNILPVTKFLNKHYNLLYYDFRYFGESDGKITTLVYKEQDDMLQAINYLKKRNISSIGILGFSLSAATSLLINSEDINAIVADSSFSSMHEVMKKVFFIFPSITKYPFIWLTSLYAKIFLGMKISELSPEEHVKSINTPILFIHGTKDSQIPVEHSKILHKNAPNSQLWLVQGADHGMSYSNNPEEYKKRVMEFFDKHLLV